MNTSSSLAGVYLRKINRLIWEPLVRFRRQQVDVAIDDGIQLND